MLHTDVLDTHARFRQISMDWQVSYDDAETSMWTKDNHVAVRSDKDNSVAFVNGTTGNAISLRLRFLTFPDTLAFLVRFAFEGSLFAKLGRAAFPSGNRTAISVFKMSEFDVNQISSGLLDVVRPRTIIDEMEWDPTGDRLLLAEIDIIERKKNFHVLSIDFSENRAKVSDSVLVAQFGFASSNGDVRKRDSAKFGGDGSLVILQYSQFLLVYKKVTADLESAIGQSRPLELEYNFTVGDSDRKVDMFSVSKAESPLIAVQLYEEVEDIYHFVVYKIESGQLVELYSETYETGRSIYFPSVNQVLEISKSNRYFVYGSDVINTVDLQSGNVIQQMSTPHIASDNGDINSIQVFESIAFSDDDEQLLTVSQIRNSEGTRLLLRMFKLSYDSVNVRDSGCFPESARVTLMDGSSVSMKELRLGDRVLISSNPPKFSEVYAWGHRDSTAYSQFCEISYSSQQHGRASIRLTPRHYMRIKRNSRLMYATAETLRTKDEIVMFDESTALVLSNKRIQDIGLYNPHTLDGDLVVDGVRVSSYTASLSPHLSHLLLWPLRILYHAFSFTFSEFPVSSRMLIAIADYLRIPFGMSLVQLS
eukprot:CAMPEP_0182451058 /NCGR_PEP_ID=MMETSP1172-20130603/43508_1 /TAXON_ID=708627 /ORGANISM="Timspurckia oligopyrenoides, Strain CCMP3278" /LENGTH=591 /DNA_ID=CAMNT_0024648793 /DNA_START=2007 /DNA_END=3782 /DNA_ORIENTATION=-